MYKMTIDVGGTFSDVVVSNFNEVLLIEKALTTQGRAFDALREAFQAAASRLDLSMQEFLQRTTMIIYGTTHSTNLIVERKTARTAFVTTAGFGDTLIYREGGKFKPHDFSVSYPAPYVLRADTFELHERIDSEGTVVQPLDLVQASEVLDTIGRRGFESIAVSLLWSFVNSKHEATFGELIARQLPHVPFTLSHRLLPSIREYRRASTVCIDASLKPIMQNHLLGLKEDLAASGFRGDFYVSTASGGCAFVDEVISQPIYSVKSGPAMAPLAALHFTEDHEAGDNVIVCDTGGTTFDVGMIRDRRVVVTRETWLGQRFTGDFINAPSVDVRSIGAGGGSIAWVDKGGLLHVGPRSAGSTPGPACYNRGGVEPTVMDAAVVLGYIDPNFFLGGRMQLSSDAAAAAIEAIAGQLGFTRERTALAILRIANETMIKSIGEMTINEGINPRDAVLVGGGGAAGLGIVEIGRELGCREVIIPRLASAFSALGMQIADLVFATSRNYMATSTTLDPKRVRSVLSEIESDLRERFAVNNRVEPVRTEVKFMVEARYELQVWEISIPVSLQADETLQESLVAKFHEEHERIFGIRDAASEIEFLNWRGELRHIVNRPKSLAISSGHNAGASQASKPRRFRPAYVSEMELRDTPTYLPNDVVQGEQIVGPAIIMEETTTIVIPDGSRCRLGENGAYLVKFD